ncbi:glycosyltransferase [Conexibacter sp. SYSU D00693]|uniref:glycosyltransferase n=1 Tax=Conexibacter sp. SYSU D00693 TaxID=2812560 RepID=UPI00196B3C95|nr:glycosyltransferase [Conexibacter sp. SYSU D00693]
MRLTVLVDHFPALSETFVLNEILSLRRIGHNAVVETAVWAQARAECPDDLPIHAWEDDGRLAQVRDLAWLVARRPLRCLADLRERRRWAREEPVRPLRVLAPAIRRIHRRETEHVHAHFAAGVALDALRINQLIGLPYSVTAHAYEIYRSPANLGEKLQRATLATGECEYSVRDLRTAAGPEAARHVHVVAMGVDHERFRRTTPLPGGKTVLAVGRLVEKKGTRHLLDALPALLERHPDACVVLLGDGPLREPLEAQARTLGVQDAVTFLGARTASGVRDALEEADVLAFPSVYLDDGDRDVLPLVLAEALAMELPVVASDMVGIPEVIRPPWGRLVAPGEPAPLADALAEVLALGPEERAAAGAEGRRFVVATRDLLDAARRLEQLIAAPTDPPPLPAAPPLQTTQVR